ncbi:AIPR family protein [Ornithinibacillus bavariensis]|uniref:Abortive phage infection protein C-terminal domain-containing protein n=1 Tax=Ornithinibacillus bavariensis TaxID=545502 RepID=A0A919XCS5_9BACI|nr:AIPR family protein [Ornithinibacillus bavariensis]GIO28280.1 hypothetical protein J43TS3_28910 [Ornithinibacillus bavariensis]
MITLTDEIKDIETEIETIKKIGKKFSETITSDQAFNILVLQYYCFKENELENIWFDIKSCITDGSDDGGLDFVYFDEEEYKVIIGQNKYSPNVSAQECLSEIHKIVNTIEDFYKGHTGKYNKKVKEAFQNAIDRLTDETEGNIEIVFSSLSKFDFEGTKERIGDLENKVSQIAFYAPNDINDLIEKVKSSFEVVPEDTIKIDKAKNWLEYDTDKQKGMFINVSSQSISRLYNKYNNKGLFNLNIRRYIKSKSVDDGINHTLNKNRDEFWFLNNGLTIACNDFSTDGDTIRLYNFSIVNGGQTTTLIGSYKGNNKEEFYIPCKIVASKEKMRPEHSMMFFNKIAEATNSQKPIQPKDLKSNAPEMINLQRLLKRHGIGLEIKRGEQLPKNLNIKIKNDIFAQLVYSFVNQKPGTARSNKKSLFNNNKSYKQVFRKNYEQTEKWKFIIDLIDLNERFEALSKEYKKKGTEVFNSEEANVFSNGKYILFGLFGVIYRIINDDIKLAELREDTSIIDSDDFIYDGFISNYTKDDINNKLDSLIKFLVGILSTSYSNQYEAGKVTSVSNFFKTDKKYLEDVVKTFASMLNREFYLKELMEYGEIFKRSKNN